MYTEELILIMLLVLVVIYWFDGMRVKEIARQTGKRACRDAEVLFLDDSVALNKVRLRWNASGQLSFYRRFDFEFTSDGEYRYQGSIDLLGKRVQQVNMDAYRIH